MRVTLQLRTYQFDDYSKIFANRFDMPKKEATRKETFPQDCQKAFDLGVKFATKAAAVTA